MHVWPRPTVNVARCDGFYSAGIRKRNAIQLNVDVKTIVEWQGHKDEGKLILDTYSHVNPVHSQWMSDQKPENVVGFTVNGTV